MNKQQVLVVLGSPCKNGNIVILAKKCVEGAKEASVDVETIFLLEFNLEIKKGEIMKLVKPIGVIL